MEMIALIIGYIIIFIIALIILKIIWNFIIYGEVSSGGHSQVISGRKVYINGKLVHTCESNNISVVNGRIYENGKLTYKYIRKKRWEK